jgi:hypothetical protein
MECTQDLYHQQQLEQQEQEAAAEALWEYERDKEDL